MTFHILGMSSSQLTILFRGVEKPPTSIYILYNMQKNATDMDFLWTEIDEIDHEPPRKSHA
jgi:hypothetical protein